MPTLPSTCMSATSPGQSKSRWEESAHWVHWSTRRKRSRLCVWALFNHQRGSLCFVLLSYPLLPSVNSEAVSFYSFSYIFGLFCLDWKLFGRAFLSLPLLLSSSFPFPLLSSFALESALTYPPMLGRWNSKFGFDCPSAVLEHVLSSAHRERVNFTQVTPLSSLSFASLADLWIPRFG